jgi:uncharacterized protein
MPQISINSPKPTIVVMAKPAIPGRVKTRLQSNLTPDQAAAVHEAMLQCVLERLPALLPAEQFDFVLALDIDEQTLESGCHIAGVPDELLHWQRVPQGSGDLGDRIWHVWQTRTVKSTAKGHQKPQPIENAPLTDSIDTQYTHAPMFFLGVDSPDAPVRHIESAIEKLANTDLVLGSVSDGGYWLIASNDLRRELLTDIDWGTSTVYDQTIAAAEVSGISVADIGAWHDVDHFTDLQALIARLTSAEEPVLCHLHQRLTQVLA